MTAYGDSVALGWQAGAGLVYGPLAAALVDICRDELDGGLVLDVGSGAGAVAAQVTCAGGRVAAADLSPAMIAAQPDRRWPAVVADVLALPFGGARFDAVIAAFLINHVDPEAGLGEMARVLRPGGVVVASTWANQADPVKAEIDNILVSCGWQAPDWYRTMKTVILPVSGDTNRLAAAAERAGLVDVSASVHAERVGLGDPRSAVCYRLATPHIAPWASALDAATRSRLIDEAAGAVAPLLAEWRPAAIFLRGRAPGQPNRRPAARAKLSR